MTSTTLPSFLLSDSSLSASPPSKLAAAYRPTPLPSPSNSFVERPTSPPPPAPPHPEQPPSPSKPPPNLRPPTPLAPSKDGASSEKNNEGGVRSFLLPLSSLSPVARSFAQSGQAARSSSFISTSSSFSSGGTPLTSPAAPLVEQPFNFDQESTEVVNDSNNSFSRPTVTRAKRSYSNHMVDAALAALNVLMLDSRRGSEGDEPEPGRETERRARGMGGDGVKSVWREVTICD